MGMTMTQKILAAHAGLEKVEAGQLILVNLDLVLGNDITSPVAIKEFNKLGAENVFDKNKVTMVMDHFAPNKDIKAAQQCKMCRDFCGEKEITNFYDVGEMGIEHALLPEKGLVVSGRRRNRRRFPYLHIRRAGRIFYRRRFNRYGVRNGDGKGMVQGTVSYKIRAQGKAQ